MVETNGVVFNIQRFSINDGPGIRTTVFLKGCPLSCLWCSNPESQSAYPELFYSKSLCVNCFRCVQICPTGATELSSDNNIRINRDLCNMCGECIKTCFAQARTISGITKTVKEVLTEVKKDALFYRNSGGGITLSGGEPTYQPQFTSSILQECHEHGYHTTIDTCGYAPWEVFESVLAHTDLVLYDIKHMDIEKHRRLTGVGNKIILDNFKKLVKTGKAVIVRVPLIPGLNDSNRNITHLGEFVSRTGASKMELLPFHQFGRGKYESLQQNYKLAELRQYEEKEVVNIQTALRTFGLDVQIA